MAENDPIGPCTPFFIVADVRQSLAHYVDKLGFECRIKARKNGPFFAMVARGSAQIMLKSVGVPPLPNRDRHEWARWDAFIYTGDPDTLAKEFAERGAELLTAPCNTDDGLRGFEIADPDGYICFFGRPL